MYLDSDQLEWHKDGRQGCMFAKLLAHKFDSDSEFWKRKVFYDKISEHLVDKIREEVNSAIENENNQILSIIIPEVNSQENLIAFLRLLKNGYPNLTFIIDDSSVENHTLISIRFPSLKEENRSFWVLIFGNFHFFPKTRQSPLFEMVLPTKTKEYLFKRYNRFSPYQPTENSVNRKGNLESSHLADIHIDNITDNPKKDNKLWETTKNAKEAILNELYGDPRSKAKNSVTLEGWFPFS